MAGRALVSCNKCQAKFLSVDDVEVHIAGEHGAEEEREVEARFVAPVRESQVVSCNKCSSKFLSAEDVETHIAKTHREENEDEEVETRSVAPGPGRETQGDLDIEAEFASNETDSDDSDDDVVDGEYHDFLEDVQCLREACMPLAQKLRASGQPHLAATRPDSRKIKRWPELQEEARKLAFGGLAGARSGRVKAMRNQARQVRSTVGTFALWGDMLRAVEGRFGSGVYNYFNFLKWSMALNLGMFLIGMAFIVIPQMFPDSDKPDNMMTVDQCNMTINGTTFVPKENATECCSAFYKAEQAENRDLGWPPANASTFFTVTLKKAALGLVQGNGWMEDTALYYGGYRQDNIGSYQTAVAYFFAIFSCLCLSLLLIVRSSAQSFRRNFKWNQFNSSQYFDLVFCSWDFSLDSRDSVHIKQLGLVNEVKTALSTDKIQEKEENMTTAQSVLLSLKRLVAWLFVFSVYGGYGFLIFYVYGEEREDYMRGQLL